MSSLSFNEVQKQLERVESPLVASELHGLICGYLVANLSGNAAGLVKYALGKSVPGDVLAAEVAMMISTLFETTKVELQDSDMGVELLLPDEDEVAAPDRMQSACDWSRGLVLGLAIQGVALDKKLPDDTRSFLEDCSTIGQSEFDADESEEAEKVYADLVEYLRTGLLMTQEEINPSVPNASIH